MREYFVSERTNKRHHHHCLLVLDSVTYAFSSTLAFSLRLMPLRLAVSATTYDGNPLGFERTGAKRADGRLGGLWNRHDLEKVSGRRATGFIL
jgi:phage terminase large subunit-like protein